MKKTIMALALMTGVISTFSASAGVTTFTYADDQSNKNWLGMPFAAANDTFECAIFLQNDEYVKSGAKVIGLRVPVRPEVTATNYEGWVTDEIVAKFVDPGEKQPALQRKEGTVNKKNNTMEVLFDEPVTLTRKGLYIGYTMDVSKQGFQPLAVVPGTIKNSLYIRTTEVLYNWRDYYETFNFVSCITVLLEGDFVEEAAEPVLADAFGLVDEPESHTVEVVNGGSTQIDNIDYSYSYRGKTYNGRQEFSPAIAGVPGASGRFVLELPSAADGTKFIDFTIDKVNGNDNGSKRATQQFAYTGVKWKPTHRPVMEEYTGTWCGYCPRGLAGMEYLYSKLGDEFVCISVHYDDVMQVGSNFPGSSARSYPSMSIDRVINGDPYYGTSAEPIVDRYVYTDYMNRKAVFAPADLEVEADWVDDEKNAINVKATATFALAPYDGATYSLAYSVTADGLTGEGNDWTQLNFYNTNDESQIPYMATELQKFGRLPRAMEGYVFDDVLVYATSQDGVKGSLPATIERETPYEHTQKLSLPLFRNKKGANMVQDKEKLNVVVLLLKNTGSNIEIANALKVKVPGKASEVEEVMAPEVASEAWYTLDGVKVARADRGIYIKVTTYADGSRRSEKVVR